MAVASAAAPTDSPSPDDQRPAGPSTSDSSTSDSSTSPGSTHPHIEYLFMRPGFDTPCHVDAGTSAQHVFGVKCNSWEHLKIDVEQGEQGIAFLEGLDISPTSPEKYAGKPSPGEIQYMLRLRDWGSPEMERYAVFSTDGEPRDFRAIREMVYAQLERERRAFRDTPEGLGCSCTKSTYCYREACPTVGANTRCGEPIERCDPKKRAGDACEYDYECRSGQCSGPRKRGACR